MPPSDPQDQGRGPSDGSHPHQQKKRKLEQRQGDSLRIDGKRYGNEEGKKKGTDKWSEKKNVEGKGENKDLKDSFRLNQKAFTKKKYQFSVP